MTTQTEFFPFPVDVRALWDPNGKSVNYAERTYRAWLDAAGQMQSQAMEFLNERMEKDSEAIARLGRCKTPIEALNVQADYAGHAFADLVQEGQKMIACFGKAAKVGMMLEGPAEEPVARSAGTQSAHKRSAHRGH